MNEIRRMIVLVGIVFLSCHTSLTAGDTAGSRMFERLKGLVGEWEGSYQWSEGRTDSGQLKTTYTLTGNGSALVENLIMGGVPMMMTVYHLDGADLRMTHYCGARNQPRLKASRIDEATGTVEFSFVDVTNAAASPAYVEGFVIRILDPEHLNLKFVFGGGPGKSGVENITLARTSSAAAHS